MLEEYRVGRFALSLPAAVRRVWQEHRLLSSVHFREVQWAADNGYKKAWSDWLRKLAERPLPGGLGRSSSSSARLRPVPRRAGP